MALPRLPMDVPGFLPSRWWQTVVRPLRAWRTFWLEVSRGASILHPLSFAYLTLLATLPVLILAMKLAWDANLEVQGPKITAFSFGPLPAIPPVPGLLIQLFLRPLVVLFGFGALAHLVLWCVEPEARGHLGRSLRVLGYAAAWMLPFVSLVTAAALYVVMNPVAVYGWDARKVFLGPGPSAFVDALGWTIRGIEGLTLLLAAWGLKVVHQSRAWKTIPAAMVAWLPMALVLLPLVGTGTKQPADATKAATPMTPNRFQSLVTRVEEARERAAHLLKAAGLPEPPRTIDLVTGGDWSAAIDLQQALATAYPPSAQRIYNLTISALKGMVIQYAACLGEAPPTGLDAEPGPLLPPRSAQQASEVRDRANGSQRLALQTAKDLFHQALTDIQTGIGPFQSEAERDPRPGGAAPEPFAPSRLVPTTQLRELTLMDLRHLANQGDPAATCELGKRIFRGDGQTPANRSQGAEWLQKAYRMGYRDPEACLLLSDAFEQGHGVSLDPQAAALWKSRAREH